MLFRSDNAGRAAAEMFLLYTNGDVAKALECVRWLTVEQVAAGWAGFFEHGLVQPADRSDAWSRHPQREELRERLMASTRYWLGDEKQDRKVVSRMLDSTQRVTVPDPKVKGRGIEVAIFAGKVHYRYQEVANGGWSPWINMHNSSHPASPKNDPGNFDNVTVRENADGRLEITAFHSFFGPFGVFRCWENKPGSVEWTPWMNLG